MTYHIKSLFTIGVFSLLMSGVCAQFAIPAGSIPASVPIEIDEELPLDSLRIDTIVLKAGLLNKANQSLIDPLARKLSYGEMNQINDFYRGFSFPTKSLIQTNIQNLHRHYQAKEFLSIESVVRALFLFRLSNVRDVVFVEEWHLASTEEAIALEKILAETKAPPQLLSDFPHYYRIENKIYEVRSLLPREPHEYLFHQLILIHGRS
ncbi:MAG: hypothetical protein AAF587_12955 [Bacteroidota bacterium]